MNILQEIDSSWSDEQQFVVSMQNLIAITEYHYKMLKRVESDEAIHYGLRTFVSIAVFTAQLATKAQK